MGGVPLWMEHTSVMSCPSVTSPMLGRILSTGLDTGSANKTPVGQRWFSFVSKSFCVHHTNYFGVMQSSRHDRLVPAVFGAANQFANVWGLVKGWHVKDGLFSRVPHHPGVNWAAGAGQGVGDRQGAVVTVTEHLEVLPQHQRPPHHTQDCLWKPHCRYKKALWVYSPGDKEQC